MSDKIAQIVESATSAHAIAAGAVRSLEADALVLAAEMTALEKRVKAKAAELSLAKQAEAECTRERDRAWGMENLLYEWQAFEWFRLDDDDDDGAIAARIKGMLDRGIEPDAHTLRITPHNEQAYPATIHAANRGCLKSLRVLLDHGADPNSRVTAPPTEQQRLDGMLENTTTPLLCACANGWADCARLLLDRGADVNLMNPLGVATSGWGLEPEPGSTDWECQEAWRTRSGSQTCVKLLLVLALASTWSCLAQTCRSELSA